MTPPQFRKFEQDWVVFKNITHLQPEHFTGHMYNACDETVQNAIINTYPNFITLSEVEALKALKSVVTQRVNLELHRKIFGDIMQGEKELIKDFVVKLRSAAIDCAYACPGCELDLAGMFIRGQFIRGLHDTTLQADVLAKSDQLKTLDELIKYAESFETAIRDQGKLRADDPDNLNVYAVGRQGKHKRNSQRFQQQQQQQQQQQRHPVKKCSGCGSKDHGGIGSNDRATKCSAWGKECSSCGLPNHFASVCRRSKPPGNGNEEVSCVDWAPDNPNNDIERVLAVQHTDELPVQHTEELAVQHTADDSKPTLSAPREDEVRATIRLGHRNAKRPVTADAIVNTRELHLVVMQKIRLFFRY